MHLLRHLTISYLQICTIAWISNLFAKFGMFLPQNLATVRQRFDSVGRAVTSITRDMQFESSHWWILFTIIFVDKTKEKKRGREWVQPWSRGYGWRLAFTRLSVQIPAPDWQFSHCIVVKIGMFVWKRPKVNEKEASNHSIKNIATVYDIIAV